jgi:uncharacterized protein
MVSPSEIARGALYEVDIAHVRVDPLRHDVRHRGYLWYVDVDDLPRHGPLARIESRDHVGDPAATLRANVESFLADHDVTLDGGRITMLTSARSLGYVFNPLTVFWCHGPDDNLRCVVAEVHNTYGQRHAYVLRPDDTGRVQVDKEFYVSPFFEVDGRYLMRFSAPGPRLQISMALRQGGATPFHASVRGTARPATVRTVLGATLRFPMMSMRVSALIRLQGVKLWLRRLPVVPRPRRANGSPS